MRWVKTLLFMLFCFAALAARAAHTQATLVFSADTAKPGDTIWAGVDMKMDPDWHTYWKNSGEAGMPTTISWQLPAGITAGDIQWPLPEKLPPVEVTTYGYNDETMLLVPLKIGSNVPPGPITLSANVAWLECKEVCIPAKQTVQATLNIGTETKPSAEAATIESWKAKVPETVKTDNFDQFYAWWEKPATDDTRPLIIAERSPLSRNLFLSFQGADFFPDASDNFEVQPATEVISANSTEIRLRKMIKKFSGDWPKEISGVIVAEAKGFRDGREVHVQISDEEPTNSAPYNQLLKSMKTGGTNEPVKAAGSSVPISKPPNAEATPAKSLASYLLSAFLGGLILNIMPCVLPVIALKILGFVSEARSEPRRVRNLGFIYALGVLVSFSVLAAVFIGLKAAGHQVAWGMQLSNPVFIVVLTTLATLVALNLFGVFEITPGGKVMNAAGNLASKHGAAGAFFNGLLATTLAASCTAPILGAALGFAFSQSAFAIFLILLFVGIGLAAPYVVLSCNPALLKFMPKPGPWMEKFKIIIGFPMLATAVWLIDIAASEYGSGVFWLGIFLVFVAAAAWVFGEFVQRGRGGKGIAILVVLILLGGGYAWALEDRLHWRETNMGESATGSTKTASEIGPNWEPWTPEAVAQTRAAGKPVLVDFTATWCVTCNAIVKPALENPSVVAKLKELGATTLLGDYTRQPQQMTEEISKYGSSGVPLVLVYPKNPDAPAIVLRQPNPLEFPSSYSKAVLAALDEAASK